MTGYSRFRVHEKIDGVVVSTWTTGSLRTAVRNIEAALKQDPPSELVVYDSELPVQDLDAWLKTARYQLRQRGVSEP